MAEFKHLVRIANTDLNGQKAVLFALKVVRGVGVPLAHAVCAVAKIDELGKIGNLTDAQIKQLDDIVKAPEKYGIPVWMLNRRKDLETGADRHVITTDLLVARDNDIKLMKYMKCYKGVRHAAGAPVRGQRTRSNFRKNKGKVLGVRVSSASRKGGRT